MTAEGKGFVLFHLLSNYVSLRMLNFKKKDVFNANVLVYQLGV